MKTYKSLHPARPGGASALGVHDALAGVKPPRLFGTRPDSAADDTVELCRSTMAMLTKARFQAKFRDSWQQQEETCPPSCHRAHVQFQLLSTSYDRTAACHDGVCGGLHLSKSTK